jgi:hypothetical protein
MAVFSWLAGIIFGGIIPGMERQKRPPGRPPLGASGEDRRRVSVYGNDADIERLKALAGKWDCSQSEAARRAILEAAQREGVA